MCSLACAARPFSDAKTSSSGRTLPSLSAQSRLVVWSVASAFGELFFISEILAPSPSLLSVKALFLKPSLTQLPKTLLCEFSNSKEFVFPPAPNCQVSRQMVLTLFPILTLFSGKSYFFINPRFI